MVSSSARVTDPLLPPQVLQVSPFIRVGTTVLLEGRASLVGLLLGRRLRTAASRGAGSRGESRGRAAEASGPAGARQEELDDDWSLLQAR